MEVQIKMEDDFQPVPEGCTRVYGGFPGNWHRDIPHSELEDDKFTIEVKNEVTKEIDAEILRKIDEIIEAGERSANVFKSIKIKRK